MAVSQTAPAINSAQKVCAIFRVLAARSPIRLTDVAEAAGITKVTALRILNTLVAEGFVERSPGAKTYVLGVEAVAMAARMRGPSSALAELARPSLLRLAARSGDTALLSVRSGTEALYIGRETGDFPVQPNILQVGSRRPLGVGAGGLALLACLPDAEVDIVLEIVSPHLATLPRLPESVLRAKIRETSDRGYAVLVDTSHVGMGGVGVPIRGRSGIVLGALSIAALSDRIRQREQALAEMLQREADALLDTLPESERSRGAGARRHADARR